MGVVESLWNFIAIVLAKSSDSAHAPPISDVILQEAGEPLISFEWTREAHDMYRNLMDGVILKRIFDKIHAWGK